MANYYTLFCGELEYLTPEEVAWATKRYNAGPSDDEDGFIDEFCFFIQFEDSDTTVDCDILRNLYLFHEDGGRPDHVAEFVGDFLREHRPRDVFSMCWAASCSSPRPDGFGGGAIVVNATEWTSFDARTWAEEKANSWKHWKQKLEEIQ